MNIETKDVYLGYGEERTKLLKEYEQFGWQYTQDVRRGRTTQQVLARDKDIPHYYEVVELDDKYFELKSKKKCYKKMVEEPLDVLLMFCLILLFVLPFVLYLLFKSNQKKRYNEYNAGIQKQMDECARKAQELMRTK